MVTLQKEPAGHSEAGVHAPAPASDQDPWAQRVRRARGSATGSPQEDPAGHSLQSVEATWPLDPMVMCR